MAEQMEIERLCNKLGLTGWSRRYIMTGVDVEVHISGWSQD